MKLWDRAGRGQSSLSLRFIHSCRSTSPSIVSTSLSTASPTARPSATDRKSQPSSYSCSSCPASSFLLHKIIGAEERGGCRVVRYQFADPACRPSCSGTQLARRPMLSRWPAYPPPSPLPPVSRCGPSAAIGTIGKQRLKMNYSVSSSSLMNK